MGMLSIHYTQFRLREKWCAAQKRHPMDGNRPDGVS
jgi:hypothetical protein